ncbi:LYR motif-containing protein 2 [Actinomortierella ambigua]|nr:LYR motif-containing protein 2 [Actinomortierella ambigua]
MRPPGIPPSLKSSRLKDGPSLEYFMTRARVLSLYREIQRTVRKVENPLDRQYLQDWARSDFERYRHETSQDKIKSLLSQGKHQFHALETNLMLSKGKK